MSSGQDASFGKKLRQLREASGLTQEELAERAGLTPKGVGALERGNRTRPYPNTVRALADALGLHGEERASFTGSVARSDRRAASTSSSRPASLPNAPTPLIGREQETEEVTRLLLQEDVRLLTLTGPGGVGKTRLATEVGHRLSDKFADGVVFVPLAQLEDVRLVLDTIAYALGLREVGGQALHDVLHTALGDRRLLLILDNFEHLTEAATDVAELLRTYAAPKVLVTSRSPLRIRGERELPVWPLELPVLKNLPMIDDLAHIPSVQLFMQRTNSVSRTFELKQANAAAIATICRRLDGLPLAIELAAARVRLMPPTVLLARLDRLLPVLTDGSRDLPERQRTMRGTVEWSYDLLSPAEQGFFRSLSAFVGGWTLEDAEAVVDPTVDVLQLLGQLVEESLVVAEATEGHSEVWYRMLEPIREFASERLEERGEAEEVRARHAAHYLALAEEAEVGLKGHDQLSWLLRLDEEHDNVRAALSWLLSQSATGTAERPEQSLRLAAALSRFWYLRGHWSEGRAWLDRVLSASPVNQPAARAKALDGAGLLALFQNDYQQASSWLDDSLALYRNLGDWNGTASALTKLGYIAAFERDEARAEEVRAAVAAIEPELKDESTIGYLLIFLGLSAVNRGEIAEALLLHRRSLSIFRRIYDVQGMVWCLTNLGLLEMASGDLSGAAAVLREDLVLAVRLGEPASTHYSLLGLATVASQEGQPVRAARLWGAAEAVRETAGMELNALARGHTLYDSSVGGVRVELGEDSFAISWAEGRAMSLEQAVQFALEGGGSSSREIGS